VPKYKKMKRTYLLPDDDDDDDDDDDGCDGGEDV
jgi:hypothetical protein